MYRAIAWPDTRNTSTVRQLEKKSGKGPDILRKKTGLPLSTYFAGVKLRWLLDNVPEIAKAHDEDRLRAGTVDTYLLWALTGGHENGGLVMTDVTNASRTMLMNLETLQWDPELLDFFGFKKSVWDAEIVSNAQVYGKIKGGALDGLEIAGMVGDQQAAMVGNRCLEVGQVRSCRISVDDLCLIRERSRPRTRTEPAASCSTTPAMRSCKAATAY